MRNQYGGSEDKGLEGVWENVLNKQNQKNQKKSENVSKEPSYSSCTFWAVDIWEIFWTKEVSLEGREEILLLLFWELEWESWLETDKNAGDSGRGVLG